MNSESKLAHEIKVTKRVIGILELWLNKSKEVEVIMDHISVVQPSGGITYTKILFKNLKPKKIRQVEAIVKDLINMDATYSESDEELENYEDLENYTNSTRHED